MKIPAAATLVVLAILPLGAQTPEGAGRSPFLPPSVAASGAASGPGETYELAGASASPGETDICLYDTATKRSRWLTVGQSDGGIQVLSFDADRNEAVVRFDGRTHVLALRQGRTSASFAGGAVIVAPAGSSAAANAPVTDPSVIGKSPETIRKEREARMLVSDLLEISIRQRKAYEEAQRKAAAQKSGGGS